MIFKVNLLINLKHLSIAGFLTPNKYGPLLLSKIPVLTKLQGLNCSNCCLKDLSPIMCLTNLKYLFCCWNELTSLPVDIGVLCNLKTLDCYHNNLTSFPSSLYELKNLKILNVNWNKFKSFPFDIELLKNLEQFYIHYNQFDSSFYF